MEQQPNRRIETIDFEDIPSNNKSKKFFNDKLKAYNIGEGFMLSNPPNTDFIRIIAHEITGAFLLHGLEDKKYDVPTNSQENLSYLCIRTK